MKDTAAGGIRATQGTFSSFQTYSLKPLGQSKPNFILEPPWEEGTLIYKNGLGYMTTLAIHRRYLEA